MKLAIRKIPSRLVLFLATPTILVSKPEMRMWHELLACEATVHCLDANLEELLLQQHAGYEQLFF